MGLAIHRGAVRVSRKELLDISVPQATYSWQPIAHHTLLDALQGEVERRGMGIAKEDYAVMRNGQLLFGVIDLNWRRTEDYAAAIGLRHANDKSYAIQIAMGVRVFVCDNLAFSGEIIAMKRKHTANIDLEWEMYRAMMKYEQRFFHVEESVLSMKQASLSTIQAKAIMYDVFRKNVLPVKMFHGVSQDWESAEEKTMWALHNAFTAQIKHLPPARSFKANIELGKFFSMN